MAYERCAASRRTVTRAGRPRTSLVPAVLEARRAPGCRSRRSRRRRPRATPPGSAAPTPSGASRPAATALFTAPRRLLAHPPRDPDEVPLAVGELPPQLARRAASRAARARRATAAGSSMSDGMAKTDSTAVVTARGRPSRSTIAPRRGASSTVRSCCFFARFTNSSCRTTCSSTRRPRRTRIQRPAKPTRT